MKAHKTTPELLLIGLAALIFLVAALALFLLQDPQAPLPWEATATASPTRLPAATQPVTIGAILPTTTPRTSYTPFATRLTILPPTDSPTPGASSTPGASAFPSQTSGPTPTGTITPPTPTLTFPPGTQAPTATITPTSAVSPTLAPGQVGISGRVVQNGAPVAGVNVSFRDDQPPRTYTTDSQGRYWFSTYAIGVDFLLSFEQSTNPLYTPSTPIASTALLYGYLPSTSGINVITLPDLEISLALSGIPFEATTPLDGAVFNSANITAANPIQFVWTTYNQAEYYYVELSPATSDEILWGSENTVSTNAMFNGTLDDGTQIGAGTYHWFVAANRSFNDYSFVIYTQPQSLVINP
mgnify:CR=1 FL=1